MEDFLELEDLLELEDGETLEYLDSDSEVTMEDFLELEEWLDSEQKLDEERNTTRKDPETSSKASIDRHQHDEIDRHPPYIIDQHPTYIIDRHPPDNIDLYPPTASIDTHCRTNCRVAWLSWNRLRKECTNQRARTLLSPNILDHLYAQRKLMVSQKSEENT